MTRSSLVVVLAFLVTSCGGDSTRPVPVAQLTLSQTSAQLSLGESITLTATPKDDDGNPLDDRTVAWDSNNDNVATVTTGGTVMAVGAGVATITATSESATADAQITVTAPVDAITLDRTTVQLAIGDSTQLVATTRDAQGTILTGRTITWGSTVGSVATVSGDGWVKGLSSGVTTITATAEEVTVQAQVTVGTAPAVTAISPGLLTPGVTATITGSDFSLTANDNTVTIDGVQAAVLAATSTELTIVVPPASLFPCTATHDADVEVTVANVSGSLAHPLQVATQRSLGVGEMISFPSAASARCNEFAQTSGRYFVAISRPDNDVLATSSFTLQGQGATTLSAQVIASPSHVVPQLSTTDRGEARPVGMRFRAESPEIDVKRHYRLLEENRAIGEKLGLVRRRATGPAVSLSRSRASLSLTTVGDTTTIKIPNTELTSFCSSAPISVRARTVYSGPHAVVLEDVAAPLAGTMDSYYQAIGQEFDDVMYPIVAANFGDPLAFDAELDNNDKLVMLFSKQVNDFGGVLGFVTSCDFLDTLAIPSAIASNQREIFYAVVPTNAGSGFDNNPGTYLPDEWRRDIRGTVIHESKHLAMYAERFAINAATLEESWLEEGMAMHSEELYGRTFTGAVWKGNTGYGSSGAPNFLWCEVRPTNASCADRPVLMVQAFAFLYDYLTDIENRTVGGRLPSDPSDASFYGSAWAFVRWMIDAYATDEGAVLRALTQEPSLSGASNLAARSGVSYEEMLPLFHYALQYDDALGLTPTAPWQHIASWQFPNVFAGLHTDFSQLFEADYLLDHAAPFGTFAFDIDLLRGGTVAHFELSGTQTAKQLLVFQAQDGSAPSQALRMTVFRVE